MKRLRFLIPVLISFLLTGCQDTSIPVTFDVAVNRVEKEITHAQVLMVSDYMDWTDGQKETFRKKIFKFQCEQNTADPVVPVIAGSVTMDLSGSFSKQGSVQINGATLSSGGGTTFGVTTTKTRNQDVSIPVTFVTVSTIPSASLMLEATRDAPILITQTVPSENEAFRLIVDREQMRLFTVDIMNSFDQKLCKR